MEPPSIIHPVAAYVLRGLVWCGDQAISLDVYRGYIVQIDPYTEAVTILNSTTASRLRQQLGDSWQDTLHGIALTGKTFWLTHGNCVYCADVDNFEFQLFAELPEVVQGIAVSEGGVYLSSRQAGKIFMLGRATRTLQRVIPALVLGLLASLCGNNSSGCATSRKRRSIPLIPVRGRYGREL